MSVIGRVTPFLINGVNYATWNPSDKSSNITLSGGNLTESHPGSAYDIVRANIGKSTGKWYCEILWNSGSDMCLGVSTTATAVGGNWCGIDATSWGILSTDKNMYHSGSSIGSSGFSSMSTGDVYGLALDAGGGIFNIYRNNVIASVGFTGLSGTLFFTAGTHGGAENMTLRCDPSTFSYTPPSGYSPIS